MSSEQLAIHGGPKAKTTPYGRGARFAGREAEYLQQALAQNTLFYGHGQMVKRACAMMAAHTGCPHVVACSSGSAAIHLGLIAAGIGPGDEVITTPNTDYGTVLGIIEEGAVPIFCDTEATLQPSARTIAARITPRTRAVLIVHLAGYPAPMDEIVPLCQQHGLPIVEDVAQSWGTRLHGQLAGTFGTAGCFSVNDYKHLSAGDGGFVVLRDAELYRRVANYADKHYDRLFKSELFQAHHGLNYRMSELQGAVACAQLEQVEAIASRYHELGERFRAALAGIPGASVVAPLAGGYATYWWTALFVDPARFTADRDTLLAAIQAEGAGFGTYGRYDLIGARVFQERVTRPWLTDSRRHYPFVQPDGRSYEYRLSDVPMHQELLRTGMRFSFGRFFTDQDIDETAAACRKVLTHFARS